LLVQQLPADIIHLGKRCAGVKQTDTEVRVTFTDGTQVSSDALIACDGVHSVVRQQYVPDSVPRYAGYTCWRGVIDQLPEGFDDTLATETWGNRGRVGIVPLAGGRIYWFACVNAPRNDPKMAKLRGNDLAALFKDYHFPVPQVLAMSPDDRIIWNDIIDIKPIRQFTFGRVALLGDAAHATTPNMGQGACQAIEDAIVLANCLAAHADIADAFRAYESRRVARTTTIMNRSRQIGRLAQLENGFLSRMRNAALRLVPARVNEKQLEFLYNVDF
jgi:2-polyprenyl-6-methoxyphenol hydroxylase-like FAD-dependent oxidoreductase